MPTDLFVFPVPHPPHLYEVSEVARILKVNPEFVRQLLRTKRLQGKLLGNRWRVKADVLQAYIDALPDEDARRRPRRQDSLLHPVAQAANR